MLYPLQEAVTHTCTHAQSLIHTHRMEIDGSYSLSYFLCLCMDVHVKKGFLLTFILPWTWRGASPGSPCMSCPALQSAGTGEPPAAFAGCNSTENLQSHWASVPGLLLCNVSLQPGVGPALFSTGLTQTERDRYLRGGDFL